MSRCPALVTGESARHTALVYHARNATKPSARISDTDLLSARVIFSPARTLTALTSPAKRGAGKFSRARLPGAGKFSAVVKLEATEEAGDAFGYMLGGALRFPEIDHTLPRGALGVDGDARLRHRPATSARRRAERHHPRLLLCRQFVGRYPINHYCGTCTRQSGISRDPSRRFRRSTVSARQGRPGIGLLGTETRLRRCEGCASAERTCRSGCRRAPRGA
jgi:hypothetical protein